MSKNLTAKFLLSETDSAKLKPSRAEVAFVGRSNVGKSTLLNAICGNKGLARVSSRPGQTRTINVYEVGHERWIVDLPGYGFATGPRSERAGWGEMIENYLTGRKNLHRTFVLIDSRIGPTPLDLQMMEWLEEKQIPWLPIATKADQVKPSETLKRRKEAASSMGLAPEALLWVSAREDKGIRELRAEITKLLDI